MKKFFQLLIVLLLLFTAERAWAIDIHSVVDNTVYQVGPERLSPDRISLETLRASLTHATGKDYIILQSELDIREGRWGTNEDERTLAREQYIEAYWGRFPWGTAAGNITRGGTATSPGVIHHTPGNDFGSEQGNRPQSAVINDPPPSTAGGDSASGDSAYALNAVDCGWTDVRCGVLKAVAWLLQVVGVKLSSWLGNLANQLFNLSIDISVRRFNELATNNGVRAAWQVTRDLVNLSFIFVLLYVAFGTILRLDAVNGKHLLKNVIIAALLVNFSALFTGLMIDASNVLANSLYTAAAGERPLGAFGAPDIITPLTNAARGGVDSTLHATVSETTAGAEADSNYQILLRVIVAAIGTIILMLVTATVLFAGAILFFVRSIVLIFVIVTAPAAFLAFAVGGDALGRLGARWKKALVNQLIFAPAYLLFIYMTIQMIVVGNAAGGLVAGMGAGLIGSFVGSLIVFAIVNGLMLGSLVVAKELGVAGAAAAIKAGGGLTGGLTRLGGRLAKKSLGAASRRIRSDAAKVTADTFAGAGRLSRTLGDRLGGTNVIGRSLVALGRGAETAGKGVGEGVVGKTVGAVGKAAGSAIKFADKNIPGARAVTDAIRKPGVFLNEGISKISGIAILGPTKDERHEQRKREKEDREEKEHVELEEKGVALKRTGQRMNRNAAEEDEKTKAKETLEKMKGKDVVKLDPETLVALAELFSDNNMKAIEDSNEIPEDVKEEIRKTREAPLLAALAPVGTPADITREIGKFTQETIKAMLGRKTIQGEEFDKLVTALSQDKGGRGILEGAYKNNRLTMGRLARIATIFSQNAATSPVVQNPRRATGGTNVVVRTDDLEPFELVDEEGAPTVPVSGVRRFLAKEKKQKLYDLGYSRTEVFKMNESAADDIITNQTRKA